jgi:hypothetical protein
MELQHPVCLCRSFEREGLAFWIDGGWGVDPLLGKQTRPHSDLAVKRDGLPAFQRVLQARAYARVTALADYIDLRIDRTGRHQRWQRTRARLGAQSRSVVDSAIGAHSGAGIHSATAKQ